MNETLKNQTTSSSLFTLFVIDLLVKDPWTACSNYPLVVLLVASLTILPIVFTRVMEYIMSPIHLPKLVKGIPEDPLDNPETLKESKQCCKQCNQSDAIWLIGVTQKSVSVVEDGVLRAFSFIESDQVDQVIVKTMQRAISHPIDQNTIQKPKLACFLDTCQFPSDRVKLNVISMLKEFDIHVKMLSEVDPNLREETMKRRQTIQKGVDAKPKYNDPPPRNCFVCRKQIQGKSSQCSACKAIIYCGPECAKQNWPDHKQKCPIFKKFVLHIELNKMHDFPFTFYNKDKKLQIYNAVIHLVMCDLHNVGLYKRLCHCFDNVPFGELSFLMEQELKGKSMEEQAKIMGLDPCMLPLDKKIEFKGDFRKLDSWQKYYEAVGLSLDSTIAFVLETPLTIMHALYKYFLPKELPSRFVVHLVGAEKECDLVHLFQILLPLFPKMELVIHMIGPHIHPQMALEKRLYEFESKENESKLMIAMSTDLYGPSHLDGTFAKKLNLKGSHKPDAVLGLNAAVMNYQEWVPSIKMLIDAKVKSIFTEVMEPAVDIVDRNLQSVQARLSVGATPNPFRQPIHKFSVDNNFGAWSNGYFFGIN